MLYSFVMARKTVFAIGEYYHVYNRGVDKRVIFEDTADFDRFLQSLVEFNTPEPIGSLYENSFRKKLLLGGSTSKLPQEEKGKESESSERLVEIVAYCLNPNHFHLLLTPVLDQGVEKFMQRLGTGYTMYFNNKYDRSGALFQGKFKAIHIDSNAYLLHVSAYINLNNRVHQLGGSTSKSSWGEYVSPGGSQGSLCQKEHILDQFRDTQDYRAFAENSLEGILERRSPQLDPMLLLE